jgi:hypothetical protein
VKALKDLISSNEKVTVEFEAIEQRFIRQCRGQSSLRNGTAGQTFAVIKTGIRKVAPGVAHRDRFRHIGAGDEDGGSVIREHRFGGLEHLVRTGEFEASKLLCIVERPMLPSSVLGEADSGSQRPHDRLL